MWFFHRLKLWWFVEERCNLSLSLLLELLRFDSLLVNWHFAVVIELVAFLHLDIFLRLLVGFDILFPFLRFCLLSCGYTSNCFIVFFLSFFILVALLIVFPFL